MPAQASHDIWLKLHRWFGVVAALFLAFAAITGCVLCFVRPLDAALNADLFKAPPVTSPVPVAEAVDRFQARHPELYVTQFPLALAPDQTIPVKVRGAAGVKLDFNQVFLARDDGRLLGARSNAPAWTRRGAMELLHDAHYTLLGGDWGKWFMGVIALGWLLSNLVGGYLTLPRRRPFWRGWKPMWRVSFKSAFARQMLDLHRASGLWLFAALAVLAFTSAGLNFFTPIYQPAVERLFPPKPSPFTSPAPFPKGVAGHLSFTRAVELSEARRTATGERWKLATVIYQPGRELYGVTLTDDGRLNYRRLGPVYWYFASDGGRFVHADSPYGDDRSITLIRALYPLHSGRMGGAPGVALVFVLGIVTFAASVTGLYIWLKRRPPRVAARRAGRQRTSAAP